MRALEQANPKRRDPRAPVVEFQRPQSKMQLFLGRWLRPALYATTAIAVLTVAGMFVSSALENSRAQEAAIDKSLNRDFNMAAVQDQISKLESECVAQRALIRQQQNELRTMKLELSAYTQSRENMIQRYTPPPRPAVPAEPKTAPAKLMR
jgi:hypothetical protein